MGLAAKHVARRALGLLAAFLLVALTTLAGVAFAGGTASAHTDFAGSTPSDGEVVAEPVELVSLVFTGESEEAGDGFVVLDASGQVREPTSVSTADNKVFTLAFDPPLAGGEIGVRWSVRAPDKHPIEGTFSFTVSAPAPEGATPTGDGADDGSTPAAASADPAVGGATDDMSEMSAEEMASMDEFLAVDDSRPGESQATLGRLLSFAGVALAIGGVAFLWTTMRGDEMEIRWMVNAIRIVGCAVAVGAAIEYSGIARIADESFAGYWSTSPGFAAVLRGVGGVAVAVGLASAVAPVRARTARSLSSAANSTSKVDETAEFWGLHDPGLAAAARRQQPGSVRPRDASRVASAPRGRSDDRVREQHPDASRDNGVRGTVEHWVPSRASVVAFVGSGLMIVSFWFDGHTVSKGWRPLHALANSVHVVAGSVWMGGVVAMTVVMWTRRRHGRPARALELVLRFSSVASVALGAVVAAGLVMAVSVLDSFGQLTGSEWGQLLLLKSAAAGLAMLGGAYNHFRLLPALDASPDDPILRDRLRSVVTAEAILLTFVVVVTVWLVVAAT